MYVMELFGKSPKQSRARPSSEFVLPSGLIGLEYEFEGVGHFAWDTKLGESVSPYFSLHGDGSLRNGGAEFVLREPLFGEELGTAIRAMDDVARALRFKSSYRTSMHVHLDMERATYPDQVLGVATVYAIFEPYLYKFVGQSRDMCNYCLPWYRHDQHFNVFLKGVKETSEPGHTGNHVTQKLKGLKEFKYAGLNFFSLGDYGTLEFRHAPVGLEANRVIQWVNIIQSLKNYVLASGQGYESILNKAFSSTPAEFANEVFGEHAKVFSRFVPRPAEAFQLGLKTASSFAASAQLLGFK